MENAQLPIRHKSPNEPIPKRTSTSSHVRLNSGQAPKFECELKICLFKKLLTNEIRISLNLIRDPNNHNLNIRFSTKRNKIPLQNLFRIDKSNLNPNVLFHINEIKLFLNHEIWIYSSPGKIQPIKIISELMTPLYSRQFLGEFLRKFYSLHYESSGVLFKGITCKTYSEETPKKYQSLEYTLTLLYFLTPPCGTYDENHIIQITLSRNQPPGKS
ncbi:hypothetical protein C922_05463 [Plasmodium inui San Antonio 1]|uniref:Uncharacterized protein n=1 Tax=Plasmodium inui San Antonio 1 TaxID=1237626 RepID=W6ZY05_9APIC|nr:hypothetical protein C922_05463 [Plasmodium inui San Antonio 1]EUD64160.1 hypothetical protein C922_05463 [Plasmodium inui San Antonio 1]